MTTGDPKQPLAQQLLELVLDLARLPPVAQASRERRTQAQPLVARFEQQRTTVRTRVFLVEPHRHRPPRYLFEQNTLSGGIVAHAKAPSCVTGCLATPFSHVRGFCTYCS